MGLMLLAEGRLVSTYKLPEENVLATSLRRCLEDLERGEVYASNTHHQKIIELEYSQEEAPIVCWIATHMGLALMDEKNLGAAMSWFEHAISVARASGLSQCVPLLQTLLHLGKAWYAAEEARKRVARTVTHLNEEIRGLEEELRAGVEHLHRALSSSPMTVDPSFVAAQGSRASQDGDHGTLHVRMLGEFAVTKENGESVPLCANRKGQTIFKLLVGKPGSRFPKDVLLETLWPDEDPDVASGKLHIAVSRLRRALEKSGLGNNVVIFENDTYRLHERLTIECDIAKFDMHFKRGSIHISNGSMELAATEYEQALEWYRGAYLTEIVGEDWPLLERMRLEEQYLISLARLAAWHFECGKYTAAAQLCRKVLALDDLREDMYRLLMHCLVRDGQRARALRLYQDLERLLQKELGVQPMKVTQELAARIRSEEAI